MVIKPEIKIFGTLEGNVGKMIQLYIQEIPLIVAGNLSHGTILDKILEENNIPFNKIELLKSDFHAEKKGKDYHAVGMGFINLRDIQTDKTIYLSSSSFTYNLRPNQEHLDKLKRYLPEITFKILK